MSTSTALLGILINSAERRALLVIWLYISFSWYNVFHHRAGQTIEPVSLPRQREHQLLEHVLLNSTIVKSTVVAAASL